MLKNAKVSARILRIPEELITLLWDLLKSINSSKMQDVNVFKEKARRLFDIWTRVFRKPLTAKVHLMLAHGADYIR